MSKPGAALIWSLFGSAEDAQAAAGKMVEEQLVACANILPGITSVFSYEGKVQSAGEVGVIFKTTDTLLNAATSRLAQLHPYDVPAICGWRANAAPDITLDWLHGVTGGDG